MRDDEPSLPDDAEAPAAPRPGIGETLRATRELRRASIEYVSELLRIEPQFLAALEEERFDSIGPPVFVRGYLKHYAELLDLDPRPLLDELRERLGREEPPLPARRSAEPEKGRPRFAAVGVGAGAAVVVLAAVAFWQLGGFEREGVAAGGGEPSRVASEQTEPQPQQGATAPERQSVTVNEPPFVSDVDEPPLVSDEPPFVSDVVEPRLVSDVVEPQSLSGGAGGLGSASSGATLAPSASGSTVREVLELPLPGSDDPPARGNARLDIELSFVEDSWTEVTSSAGERLFYGLARAGAAERIRADDEVRVLLGNADGVVVRVNGEPFAYPAGSRSGDLARFRLSPTEE